MISYGARISAQAVTVLLTASLMNMLAIAQQPFALTAPSPGSARVVLALPLDYQVFQRETRLEEKE